MYEGIWGGLGFGVGNYDLGKKKLVLREEVVLVVG